MANPDLVLGAFICLHNLTFVDLISFGSTVGGPQTDPVDHPVDRTYPTTDRRHGVATKTGDFDLGCGPGVAT